MLISFTHIMVMLHAQNAAPLPHHYYYFFFREIDRIFRVSAYYTYKNNNFD
jgi:hypothetical protein